MLTLDKNGILFSALILPSCQCGILKLHMSFSHKQTAETSLMHM